ncbi:MAG: dTDP-4-dehydrorhamnose reductase [Planctomycetes bacterium]|nr:dTDP-4-dehydrorhamnose reductase [Planctomycetota bacterium]
MRVLVTGGGGLLGTALSRTRPPGVELESRRHAELDVTDGAATRAAIAAARPDWVIHGAAFTDVDGCEADPQRALRVNWLGTANVVDAAARAGAGCVCLSTDYVFDGTATAPYLEHDPTAPQSAYGRSKRFGELEALARGGRVLVVRTQWVFGAGGRNFVDTILKAARERPSLKVVADQRGCPTWSNHLARGLWQLLAADAAPGLWHLSATGDASWHEFACAIVAGAGLATPVAPCTTADFPRPARRPAYGVLSKQKFAAAIGAPPPSWQEGLAGYLAALREGSGGA